MKKTSLIIVTLALFGFSVYLAFLQGSVPVVEQQEYLHAAFTPTHSSQLIFTGFRATAAMFFAGVFNAITKITGGNVLLGIMGLGVLVELLLLYPSVRIQLKQKKIHLFHKKLVDRFSSGELSVSKTEDELHKLYDVNEKIHQRGALMVVTQIALFFFTFWGLSLMVKAPNMLAGSWNVFNFSLLSRVDGYMIPLLTGVVYFLHAMVKIYYKEKEDYISPSQITMAMVMAFFFAVLVYMFASMFAVALTVYFLTLLTVSTIRYIIVEQHAKAWGKLAQRELIQMLKKAGPHHDRFEYFSRMWNHLPIVRHLNFNLLEEALSMTLGLLLALSFFGAFQNTNQHAIKLHMQSHSVAPVVSMIS